MRHAALAALLVIVLATLSLFVGVADVSLSAVLGGQGGDDALILLASRIPRTLAIILTGASMAIAGLIFQMLTRNKFVEPSTAGTAESAGLGLLVAALLLPGAPIFAKMLIASGFAVAGTMLFLRILRALPPEAPLLVPLVGLMLGGVIASVTTFFAYQFDLLQFLGIWTTGEFSGVMRTRYELLWLTAALALIGYLAADRFSIIGMGQEVTLTLGLNYRRVMWLGLIVVAVITAVIVVTVGAIPFLGLIVPNIVSRTLGDNLRAAVPWAAGLGAGLLLLCDIVGRLVRYPYEIPIGTVFGVLGAGVSLLLLLRRDRHAHG
ncbi:MAG: iron ABC transporter permease [Confluentimicrobium sp.]|uniref:ABC transporter permease n=1 Tax=Actibacterium sp. TaxID=1872125 RepID=UPI000C5EAD25|nr:iron chelate uptake ABC transporter family permease subunit [Actibacterium sp.]MBC56752.1 iron ABC transporter permease [Actibacterium sp.]|tara:strand:+ start:3163 stop:4125 length:963 start_codon:yes stop_codon:yes gene_type:complete